MPRVTKRVVDATHATDGRAAFAWDSEIKGFGLIAHPPSARHPNGSKVYVLRYFHNGRDRRMTLGRHGELTADQARQLAAARLVEVRAGRDPLAERQQAREATRDSQTVEWLFERYIEARSAPDAKPRPWKPGNEREVRRLFKSEIQGSALGACSLRDVTTREIEAFHRHYMTRERPSRYIANRTLSWLSGAFRFALREGYRTDGVNPCAGVTRFEEFARDRSFTLKELERLGQAMDELVTEAVSASSEKREKREKAQAARDAMRLVALTGLRRSNVLGLRWSEVDFEERLLELEDTKTGRKLKAIGPEVLELLERRRASAREGDEWVFPSRRNKGPLRDLRELIYRVYTKAGIMAEVSREKREKREKSAVEWHVWRSTYASHAGELGYSDLVIGHMLGHAKRSVTSKYVRIDEIVRAAEERTQARIAAALDRKPPAEVIEITQRENAS